MATTHVEAEAARPNAGSRTSVASRRPRSASRTRDIRYRPELDGVRAVAVYLVVAFHAGLGVFSGGFIGVDVFFVLSGFFVTSLLVRDITQRRHVDFRKFYSRRARRILPAAVATLAVTAVAYAAVATPLQRLDVVGSFRAAALYVANWFFVKQSTNYFGGSADASPVLHFWSLAVEEQYYLLWPLVLTGLVLACRRARRAQWWVLRGSLIVLATLSAFAAWQIGRTNVSRAYFGTDTRAYQLLLGALLALTPQIFRQLAQRRRAARWLAPAALVALFVVASSAIGVSPITRGFLAAVVTVTLIVTIQAPDAGVAKRALSFEPMAYLGRLSYGTYLWHWPVIVLITMELKMSAGALFAIACVISTALAALSFHLMEQPIRWSRALDKVPVPSIVAGLLVSAILAAFVIPVALRQYGPFRATDAVNVDWRAAKNDWPSLPDCLGRPLDVCTVVHGTKGRVLLLGDSYAHMWAPALEEIARKESLTLSVAVLDACPWQRGLTYTSANLNGFFTPFDKACKQTQADWYDRVLPQFKPDLVVVGQPVLDDPKFRLPLQFPDGRTLAFGQPGYGAEVVAVTKPSLTALQARAKVVVLKGTPSSFPYNPLDCLSTGTSPGRCAYKADTAPTTLDKFYSAYHAPDRFWNVNLDRVVCPRYPVCDAVVNHRIVRFDANGHLTATFARSVAPEVEAIFRKDGVLRSLDGG